MSLAGLNGAPALAASAATSARPPRRHANDNHTPAAAYYSTGGQLRSVAAASANNAWAVGYAGTGSSTAVLMLHWNGKPGPG